VFSSTEGACASQTAQAAHLHRLALLPQPLQSRCLFGGHPGHGLWQLVLGYGLQEDGRARPGLVLRARGHDPIEHLTPAAQVIVGHPAGQPQEVGVEERLVIEDADQFLDRAGGCCLVEVDAEADRRAVALAEGGLHPLADRHLFAQPLGDGVGVGVVERAVEDDLRKQPRGLLGWVARFEEQLLLGDLGHGHVLPG
jgi:hypothetical protein